MLKCYSILISIATTPLTSHHSLPLMQLLTFLREKHIVEEYSRRKQNNERARQSSLARWGGEALELDNVLIQSMIRRTM